MPTIHPHILKAQEQFLDWDVLNKHLTQLNEHIEVANIQAVYAELQKIVSGFTPDSDIVDLIEKAQLMMSGLKL